MRTLFTLTFVLLAGVWVAVWVYIDERDEELQHWAHKHVIDSLQREIRMGPKPYCFAHHDHLWTALERDSVIRYASHMRRYELLEVKEHVTENPAVKGFIDTILLYKDSLQHAQGMYADE